MTSFSFSKRVRQLGAVVVLLACGACSTADKIIGTVDPALPASLALQPIVTTGLSVPIYLTAPPNDSRLFVVEKGGQIRIVQNGTLLTTPFLDITSLVSSGDEQGLLSVAFHPQYAANGYFYVYYTDVNGDIQIDRFTASSAVTNVVNVSTRSPVLNIPHPGASNHNGGLATFGLDGMLYLGVGDGGTGGANGQALNTLLGKLLRIDVTSGTPYVIPSSNPYVNQSGARGEIWASGLRNPWRYSFDATNSLLYVADVGQDRREEVDVVSSTLAGANYGWNIMEGSLCYGASTCATTGLQVPVLEYDHTNNRCAIVGGFVYRGSAMPGLNGYYVYSDNCAGGLNTVRYTNGSMGAVKSWGIANSNTLSFGEDANHEVYMLLADGSVSKIVAGN